MYFILNVNTDVALVLNMSSKCSSQVSKEGLQNNMAQVHT